MDLSGRLDHERLFGLVVGLWSVRDHRVLLFVEVDRPYGEGSRTLGVRPALRSAVTD